MSVYATIANTSASADTLTSVSAADALSASIHATMDHGGTMMMMPASSVVIGANSVVRLAPGGTHIMLERLARQFVPGDTLPLTFVFSRGGRVTVNASVLAYDQIQAALER